MTLELTPTTAYIAVLGLLHGYFFFTLTIFLARPLSELASKPARAGLSKLSRNITHGMAIAFLITLFFSLSLVWLLLISEGSHGTVREYFRPWALFWFVGIVIYCGVIRFGRSSRAQA